ncbi:MAG: hypothetical protein K0U13_04900 [Chlamydiae bacterium]|nr:hypothetical protein [Chlamydiales bacterium]MCH9704110.1 hypothetical protein [Chlamydiota bacterium]
MTIPLLKLNDIIYSQIFESDWGIITYAPYSYLDSYLSSEFKETLINSHPASSANLRAAASFSPSLTRNGLASGSEFLSVANLGRISKNRVNQYLLKYGSRELEAAVSLHSCGYPDLGNGLEGRRGQGSVTIVSAQRSTFKV